MIRKAGEILSAAVGYGMAVAGFAAGSGRAPGGPVSVFIEPANVCNLRCPLCACGSGAFTRPRGRMSYAAFRRVIDSLPSSVRELYLWGQGEPFMAPGFLDMVRYASSRGFRTVTSTNGHFLDEPETIIESGLDVLVVSVDGTDAGTYEAYRKGGDFERVVGGIARLAGMIRKRGRGPVLELQCIATRDTVSALDDFESFAASLGVHRAVVKTVQAASMENGGDFLPGDMGLTRYRRDGKGGLETDRRFPFRNRCLRIYYSFQIDWRGNVLPCCFDKDSEFVMGNVFNDAVETIWNSPEFRSFRKTIAEKGRIFPMCRDCTEGLKRRYVRRIEF